MKGWKRYMATDVMTSNPVKVTIMAYEKSINTLKTVYKLIEEKKWDDVTPKLENMQKLYTELKMQINYDAYPELGENLDRLYDWVLRELQIINSSKDKERIQPVIDVIKDLLDGYREVLKKSE